MDLAQFHNRLKEYLRNSGKTQKELANSLSLHPNVLSHKLKGSRNYILTHQNIREIVQVLAEWEAFTSRQQVLDLLAPANLTESLFTAQQWRSAPLNRLEVTAALTTVPPAKKALPHNLPAALTPLVGRKELARQLSDLLRRDGVRLVTLTGLGGVGKTRLALEIASASAPDFKDGVFFVGLSALREAAQVPGQLAEALGIKQTAKSDLTSQLKSYLQAKTTLLVLDNFEQILEASAFLVELLTAAPGLKILVTSRVVLEVYGEYEVTVPPLSLPDIHDGAVLRDPWESEAVRLFYERSLAANPAFRLTDENALAVARLCIYLEGIPLGIELAAAWGKMFSPEKLLERLAGTNSNLTSGGSGRLKMLAREMPGLPARHQTLRNTLDWSYNLLKPAEQALFNRLGIFTGSFTQEAFEAVCLDSDDTAENGLAYLTLLVNQSMLQCWRYNDTNPYFALFETLREYALEKLQASGEWEKLQERHAAYYLGLAEEAEYFLQKSDQGWIKRLTQAQGNLWAAIEWCKASPGRAGLHLRLVSHLWRFWMLTGRLSEGFQRLEAALGQANWTGDTALTKSLEYARALVGAGALASFLGNLAESEQFSRDGLVLMKRHDNQLGQASCYNNLGLVAWQQRDYSRYQAHLTESLKILRLLDDRPALGVCLNNLGVVAQFTESFDKARDYFLESMAIREELGDMVGVAVCLNNLGLLAQREGNYQLARNLYLESLALKRELNDKLGICSLLNNLGVLLLLEEEFTQSRQIFLESLAVGRELGYKSKILLSLLNLGLIDFRMGDFVQSAAYYRESLPLARELKDPQATVVILVGLAALASREGRLDRAARLCALAEVLMKTTTFSNETNRSHYRLYDETRQILQMAAVSFPANRLPANFDSLPLDHLIEYTFQELELKY